MIDQTFLEEPRILMGLNKRNRQVQKLSKQEEEAHFRRASLTGAEKDVSVMHIEQAP